MTLAPDTPEDAIDTGDPNSKLRSYRLLCIAPLLHLYDLYDLCGQRSGGWLTPFVLALGLCLTGALLLS